MLKRLFARRLAADPHEPRLSVGKDVTVPRQIVILRAKEPLRQWLSRSSIMAAVGGPPPLAEIRADPTAYLVPIGEGEPADAKDFLKANYGRFFAQELADWTEDTRLWPPERSLARSADGSMSTPSAW